MNKPPIGWGVLAMLGVCAVVAGALPAQAAVRYELQSQAPLTDRPEFLADAGLPTRPYPLTFAISDLNGDVADFISLRGGGDALNAPQSFVGSFDLQALFAPDRLLADLLLEFNSTYGNLVGDFLNSDRIRFCDLDACFIVGRVEIAEPISAALLGVGLFGMAAARRRALENSTDDCPQLRARGSR